MIKIYGIKNCSTVKKALDWIGSQGLEFEFHDYKKEGADEKILRSFSQEFGWEIILNKKGTTWRKLSDGKKLKVVDVDSAVEVMIDNPSMIKRPLIECSETKLVGFDETEYKRAFVK